MTVKVMAGLDRRQLRGFHVRAVIGFMRFYLVEGF